MKWLLLLLLLSACATEQPSVPEAPRTYQDIFTYDDVTEFTYRARIQHLTAFVTTTIEPLDEGYNLLNTVHLADLAVRSDMRIDSQHVCVATHIVIENTTQEDACPLAGLNARSSAESTPVYAGAAHVTVPLGTFSVEEYVVDGVSYYLAQEVPIPVRYEDEGYVMELVSWTR